MTKRMNGNSTGTATVWMDVWGVPVRTVSVLPGLGGNGFGSSLIRTASEAFTKTREKITSMMAFETSAVYTDAA